MHQVVSIAVALVALTVAQPAAAADSKPFQDRYCDGMDQEVGVSFGGRADCLSETHAIEVEWVEDWYHAVGQVLYYATVTDRKPGIILLCPGSAVEAEGECRSYIYRLEQALTKVAEPVAVWECFPENETLADCLVLDLQGGLARSP